MTTSRLWHDDPPSCSPAVFDLLSLASSVVTDGGRNGHASYIGVTLPSLVHRLWGSGGPVAVDANDGRAAADAPAHSTGATRSMSSMQWRGGSGTSSLALVMRTSVPHSEHR